MTIIEERFMNQVIQIPILIRELIREVSELNEQLLARAHFWGGLPLVAALRRMFGE